MTDPMHGSVQLNLKDYQLKLQSNDKISLDQLLIQMIRLHNIPESYHYMTVKQLDSTPRPCADVAQVDMIELNDGLWDLQALTNEIPAVEREIVNGYLVDKIFFPKCKIATVGELCVVLNNLLLYHGIHVEMKEHSCSIQFTSLSKVESVEMPVKVASSLGLLRDDGSVAKFLSHINVPVTFELLQSDQRLRLTKSGRFNEYKLILLVNRDF